MDALLFRHEEIVAVERAGERLDMYLTDFPFDEVGDDLLPSRTTIQSWIENGNVAVNGVVCLSKSYKIRTGDTIVLEVRIEPDIEMPYAEDLDIEIVYQDEHIIVLNKPTGISSHPAKSAMTGSVVNFLLHKGVSLPQTSNRMRPGIVHRLDKLTSGLMVVACSDIAMVSLIEMIKRREVERKYLAIVYGNPPSDSGVIDAPIGRHEVMRQKMAVTTPDKGREARTHYRILVRYPAFSLVGCKLDTGRTHQIRVHMSHIGYPVAGDRIYGGGRAVDRIAKYLKRASKIGVDVNLVSPILQNIAQIIMSDNVHLLHAAQLNFPHPVTSQLLSFSVHPHEKFMKIIHLLDKLPHRDIASFENAF